MVVTVPIVAMPRWRHSERMPAEGIPNTKLITGGRCIEHGLDLVLEALAVAFRHRRRLHAERVVVGAEAVDGGRERFGGEAVTTGILVRHPQVQRERALSPCADLLGQFAELLRRQVVRAERAQAAGLRDRGQQVDRRQPAAERPLHDGIAQAQAPGEFVVVPHGNTPMQDGRWTHGQSVAPL